MGSIHVKRALVAAAVVGAAVAAILAFSFLNEPPSETAGVVDRLFAAAVFGAVPAAVAGAVTFVISRFQAGKRSAWIATGVCLLLSIVGGGGQPTWADRLDPSVHAALWVIVWPLVFGSSLLTELRWMFGKAVYDQMRRPAAPAAPPPPPAPPPMARSLAPSPTPPRR